MFAYRRVQARRGRPLWWASFGSDVPPRPRSLTTLTEGGEVTEPPCNHDPDPGTAYTTTGLPADLGRKFDFPADAKCQECGQWLRLDAIDSPPRLKYPDEVTA